MPTVQGAQKSIISTFAIIGSKPALINLELKEETSSLPNFSRNISLNKSFRFKPIVSSTTIGFRIVVNRSNSVSNGFSITGERLVAIDTLKT